MLIPLILCIFPVTFLLTVSPVIIRVLRSGVFGQ
jgi:pilus assembly protein TadC